MKIDTKKKEKEEEIHQPTLTEKNNISTEQHGEGWDAIN